MGSGEEEGMKPDVPKKKGQSGLSLSLPEASFCELKPSRGGAKIVP